MLTPATLTQAMQEMISNYPLAMVATVNEDGTPNLSPKGTFVIADEQTLLFSEIRSPATLKNLKERPALELAFLDILSRKALRVAGKATIIAKQDAKFTAYLKLFDRFSIYKPKFRHIIQVTISKASIVTSPAYDLGITEQELRQQYQQHIAELAEQKL